MELFPDLVILEGPDGPLHGYFDLVDWRMFGGWALNPSQMDVPLWLEAQIDDGPWTRFMANMHRSDLADLGIGSGRYGFHLHYPAPLDPSRSHKVSIRRVSDGLEIPNSPRLLPAASMVEPQILGWIEGLFAADIEAARSATQLETITRFLVTQTDRVLQAGADLDSGRAARAMFRRRWAETLGGTPLAVAAPDPRRLALFIGLELPVEPRDLAPLRAAQALGMRVAVTAARGLAAEGEAAETLRGSDVLVLGAPGYFTAEDMLRRHADEAVLVVLRGAVAAAGYAMLARLHQPRARVLAILDESEVEPLAGLAAQLMVDAVLTGSAAAAQALARRVQGRDVHVAAMDDELALRQAFAAACRRSPANPARDSGGLA